MTGSEFIRKLKALDKALPATRCLGRSVSSKLAKASSGKGQRFQLRERAKSARATESTAMNHAARGIPPIPTTAQPDVPREANLRGVVTLTLNRPKTLQSLLAANCLPWEPHQGAVAPQFLAGMAARRATGCALRRRRQRRVISPRGRGPQLRPRRRMTMNPKPASPASIRV